VVYSTARLPGYTRQSDLKVDVTAARTVDGGVHDERSPGSDQEKPMGERPLCASKLSFLLMFVGPSAQSCSALPGRKEHTIG